MKSYLAVIGALAVFCPAPIEAAPCQEFADALTWSEQTTSTTTHPVAAYFTKHFGTSATGTQDAVHYAFGYVVANPPLSVLSGTLKVVRNSEENMTADPALTYSVQIAWSAQSAQITYQMLFNGKSPGGGAATTAKATCVNNVLLTAINGSEVVTVGVAQKPIAGGPPPK